MYSIFLKYGIQGYVREGIAEIENASLPHSPDIPMKITVFIKSLKKVITSLLLTNDPSRRSFSSSKYRFCRNVLKVLNLILIDLRLARKSLTEDGREMYLAWARIRVYDIRNM